MVLITNPSNCYSLQTKLFFTSASLWSIIFVTRPQMKLGPAFVMGQTGKNTQGQWPVSSNLSFSLRVCGNSARSCAIQYCTQTGSWDRWRQFVDACTVVINSSQNSGISKLVSCLYQIFLGWHRDFWYGERIAVVHNKYKGKKKVSH